MNVEELWHKFCKDFWDKQCCPYPCINFQNEDGIWIDGAEAFYKFIVTHKGRET